MFNLQEVHTLSVPVVELTFFLMRFTFLDFVPEQKLSVFPDEERTQPVKKTE